jgi:hypothetical protein
VEFDSPGDVGDAGLSGLAGREVAGLLGFPGAGAVGQSRTRKPGMRIFSRNVEVATARSNRCAGRHSCSAPAPVGLRLIRYPWRRNPADWSRSQTVALMPALRRPWARHRPPIPPPMITTCHHAGTHARQPRQWCHHAPGITRTETSSRTARSRPARLPDWPGSTADTTKNTQPAPAASITSPQNQSLQKSRTRSLSASRLRCGALRTASAA